MKKFAREFFRLQIFFSPLHVTRCVISSRFSIFHFLRVRIILEFECYWEEGEGVPSSASVHATSLATIRIFLILLHRARPIKRWRSIVRRLITNNRTFTALNSWSNETYWRAQRCIAVDTDSRLSFMHYILQRISFASITVDRCANCRSRVKRIDSMERDGKYAAPLESSSLTVRSIIEVRNRTVCNLWKPITGVMQVNGFNFRDKRCSKMSNNRWNLPTFHRYSWYIHRFERKLASKTKVNLSLYCTRDILSPLACQSCNQFCRQCE